MSSNETLRTRTSTALALGFIGVTIFSLSLPMTRVAVVELGALLAGLGRIVIAALVAGLALAIARAPRVPRPLWRGVALVALGVVLGFPLFTSFALAKSSASAGAVVVGLLPLATAAYGAIVLGERPSTRFWIAAIAGSLLVLVFVMRQQGVVPLDATVYLLIAVALGAIGYGEGARLTRTLGGWQTIAWALVFAAPVSVAALAIHLAQAGVPSASLRAWASLGYLALFSQFLGFIPWYAGLRMGGVARVSQVQLLQVFLTIGFSWLLLSEPIGAETIGFAAAVVATVAIAQRVR